MSCNRKYTVYQPTEKERVCPNCGDDYWLSIRGILPELVPIVDLHEGDLVCCSRCNGDWTGKEFVERIQSKNNAVVGGVMPKNSTEWKLASEFDSIEEYCRCYVWLTTTTYNQLRAILKEKRIKLDKYNVIPGHDSVLAFFEFWKGSSNGDIEKGTYWQQDTWICGTFLNVGGIGGQHYYHYQMSDGNRPDLPPIPMHLVCVYNYVKY